ncbi:hypothetical protein [Kiloniella antarctica]|uniref:O-methyltransferase domain-containing protein n=1 Tax=Kiloniella antarctica TaxID=1550907 RepID=A0ABW5BI15_9PROT
MAETHRGLTSDGRFILVEEIFEKGHGLALDEIQEHLIDAGFKVVNSSLQYADGAQMHMVVARNNKEN